MQLICKKKKHSPQNTGATFLDYREKKEKKKRLIPFQENTGAILIPERRKQNLFLFRKIQAQLIGTKDIE